MGKFSYKKRKGMKKQSFKNRKKTGGTNHEKEETKPVVEENTTGEGETATVEEQTAPVVDGDTSAVEENVEQNDTSDSKDANPTEEVNENVDSTSDGTQQQGDSDETTTPPLEGLQSEPLTTEDEKALEQADDLNQEEIDAIAQEIASNPDAPIPPWARVLLKSGAAGQAAKFLNKNPELKAALIKRATSEIQNSGSSGPVGPVGNAGPSGTGTEVTSGQPGSSQGLPQGSSDGFTKFLNDLGNANNSDAVKNVLTQNLYIMANTQNIYRASNAESSQWVNIRDQSGKSTPAPSTGTGAPVAGTDGAPSEGKDGASGAGTDGAPVEGTDGAPDAVEGTDGATTNETTNAPVEQTQGATTNETTNAPVEQTQGATTSEVSDTSNVQQSNPESSNSGDSTTNSNEQ